MRKKFLFILLAFAFFVPAQVHAEKVVFVTVEDDIPPNLYTENAQITGIYADIIKEVCTRLGIEPEMQRFPWKRCVENVKTGKADAIFPPILTKERTEFLYFPDEPMMMKRVVIFARKESGIRMQSLDDLKDKTVGVNRGYSYGEAFDNMQGLKKDESGDIMMQVKKLANRRMDVAVSVEAPFKYHSRQLGFTDQLEVIYTISEEASYVAFSQASGEKGKILSEKFSQVLAQLKKEGVIQKIEDKYLK